MDLNNRKIKILQAIIMNYLDTAEPVGSRTISKRYELGVSSATIRNEMSDLEDLGFIVQPHTSAGRVPSDKGYRFYVDELMNRKTLNDNQVDIIKKLLMQKIGKLDTLLQETAKILALLTNYTTMVTAPQYNKTKLKHMQLIPLDEASIMLIVVTDGNIVRNHTIDTKANLDIEMLNQLSNLLNHNLHGLTIEDINLPLIQKIKAQMGEHSELLNSVLDAVADTIQYLNDVDIYTSGTTNILSHPEFNDVLKAKNVIHALEEKDLMISMLKNANKINEENDIKISIGKENQLEEVKDCSIITASYSIGGKKAGTFGILGPTRMDYERVVATLNYVARNINDILNNYDEKT